MRKYLHIILSRYQIYSIHIFYISIIAIPILQILHPLKVKNVISNSNVLYFRSQKLIW